MRTIYKINWILISLISLSGLYIILVSDNYSMEGNQSEKIKVSSILREFREDHQEIKNELRRNSTLNHLWRNNENNQTQDKVKDLGQWVKLLANSTFIKDAKVKKILVFDGMWNYYGTNGELKCEEESSTFILRDKCIIKEDKTFELTNVVGYDAFVNVRNWKVVIYDRIISSVKHIYYIEESPYVAKYADFNINNAILASYWRGSDIVLPYRYYSKFRPNNKGDKKMKNYSQGKNKLMAIIVSNCEAQNDRLKYVKELQKYIAVDIYGDCGSPCQDCYAIIKKQYKFYLAFEKANCRDYITEKFWVNALGNDAIPIVMGAHPSDYASLAPPHSYIHIEDFSSPKNLAEYILLLHNNESLYNEYFQYKQKGEILHVWKQFFCRLCALLYYADFVEPPIWNKGSSWSSVNQCLPLHKWYWNRDN